jgi:hypothetical protein
LSDSGRRTKWIFIQWVGDKMGMVQRGQVGHSLQLAPKFIFTPKFIFVHWFTSLFLRLCMVLCGAMPQANAAESAFKERLRPFNLSIVAHHIPDLRLAPVVDRVAKSIVVDGRGEIGESADAFTIDAFQDALAEEAKRSAAYFGQQAPVASGGGFTGGFMDAIEKIRDHGSPLNWGLFAPPGQY